VHLRFNEPEIGTWVLRTEGDGAAVLAAETVLDPGPDQGLDPLSNQHNWLTREVRLLWERVLKRLDLSARTLIALVEPSSCFAGVLAELVLAADRSFMLDGSFEGTEAVARLQLSAANDGWVPMSNGLSRLASRFWGRTDALEVARKTIGTLLDAAAAREAELVTFTPDDIDWDDDVRIAIEERASFSPDALTAMEANFRFVGPETIETKIFARLTAWQNWIFQRPNAVGPDGALHRFGTGSRPVFDKKRV
jgi:benzoyl-CoA-dihydrodiol lyase